MKFDVIKNSGAISTCPLDEYDPIVNEIQES
jgi:hypothetical protein